MAKGSFTWRGCRSDISISNFAIADDKAKYETSWLTQGRNMKVGTLERKCWNAADAELLSFTAKMTSGNKACPSTDP
jgi:hypothetical protein